jgi:anti-anti-sigma regulatory factor
MNARFHAARVGQGMCVVTGEREARAESAEDLREALSAAVAAGCRRVLVDLQESDHVDPLVLGAILGSQRRLARFDGEMAVACGNPSGHADLERAALPRVMTVFDDRQDAFEWLGVTMKEIPNQSRL